MSIPLPNLDDRNWSEIVAENIALLPAVSPTWTDHNVHDPGRMVIELLAAEAEQHLYWLNRVPATQRRQFLALAGIVLQPAKAAQAVVQFTLKESADPVLAPAGLQIGSDVLFRTVADVQLAPGAIASVQSWDGQQFNNLTRRYTDGRILAPFGKNPKPGAAFYLGFTAPLPHEGTTQLYFSLMGDKASAAERQRIQQEQQRLADCLPPYARMKCGDEAGVETTATSPLRHHAVTLAWDVWTEKGWRATAVTDHTRSLTLSGTVIVAAPPVMQKTMIGTADQPYYYLRCRLESGAYEAAPLLANVALNGVMAEQAVPVAQQWPIAKGAQVTGNLQPNSQVNLQLTLDQNNGVAQLKAEPAESLPDFRVLAYAPASSTHIGSLQLDAVLLGQSDGRPNQQWQLPQPPILAHSCRIYTFEEAGWIAWEIKPDLVASAAADSHVMVNFMTGQVQFGDGQRGRVAPKGAPVVAQYDITTAEAGNLPAGALTQLAATIENQLRPEFEDLETAVARLTNCLPAWGGTAAETIGQAMARYQLTPSPRAVTLADYERLAMATPGVQVARVEARANVHPAMPQAKAPGIITVIVLPELPQERPSPSLAMRQQIKRYLNGRRLIGTRVEVVGPTWTEIRVRAEVAACEGVDTAVLPQKVSETLAHYFHPLTGGAAGMGWPFGRDVYLTELYQVIDNVPGVDHVLSLGILNEAGQLSCSNVCIDSFGLVFSGAHEISVAAQNGRGLMPSASRNAC